ncbi:hypothetical protein LCGC14_0019880 [marine sediment metagenome]|uniref:Uncharacterized protein n=1 Tax=marine sediment metagenome TaxID=412755 RepID=A0A0F9Z0A6_9ZZZZ
MPFLQEQKTADRDPAADRSEDVSPTVKLDITPLQWKVCTSLSGLDSN